MQKYGTHTRWHLGNIPVVSGGADGGDDDESGADDDESDDDEETPPPKGKKTIDADRVDQIVNKRVGQAERRARQELAKSLGYESVEAMREAHDKGKVADSEEAKDLAKERAKVDADKAETARIRAEAEQDRLNLQVERTLLLEGVTPKKAAQAVRLIDLKLADEPDETDIQEAVEAFKEEWSELFNSDGGGDDDENPPPPTSRVPGSDVGRQPKKKPQGSASDRATAKLRERHPELATG